jgi:copper homeostasis protein
MKHITVEICAQSLTSAKIAQNCGADRIELCSALELGGITPSYAVLEAVRAALSIPICVLVRPRAGDFIHTEDEFEIIKRDVWYCREMGMDAAVVGILDYRNRLHMKWMQELYYLAQPMDVVCHRAFDRVADPHEALEQLKSMRYHRVLTSGSKPTATEGAETLKKLVDQSSGNIDILAGSGVTADNVLDLIEKTGVSEVHLSAKQFLKDKNCYETDPSEVKKVMKLLGRG